MLAAPARGEEWIAVAGQGAWLNGQPLHASTRTQFAGARVPTHTLPREDADLAAVEQPNSIALRIAMVADDRADLVATLRWGFEWDIAAATLIAREAGAEVSDASQRPRLGPLNRLDQRVASALKQHVIGIVDPLGPPDAPTPSAPEAPRGTE
jgi:myo-inositol-1(or 4)-monophosphatase